jgi:tRNA(Glu) U13 pseudouridine synthase TruD
MALKGFQKHLNQPKTLWPKNQKYKDETARRHAGMTDTTSVAGANNAVKLFMAEARTSNKAQLERIRKSLEYTANRLKGFATNPRYSPAVRKEKKIIRKIFLDAAQKVSEMKARFE